MTAETISILIGFGVLIFNAGIQWIVISLIKGNMSEFDFIHHKLDDEFGQLCGMIGNACQGAESGIINLSLRKIRCPK
jgi:hypothetical protein